jgi:hypothetical protein
MPECTYKILVTLNVEDINSNDGAIKECLYNYLQELIEEDTLYFELEKT